MTDRDTLYAKSKHSCVVVGMPKGSHVHHGFCVLPTDEKYFQTDVEVEEYEKVVVEDWLAKGFGEFTPQIKLA